MRKYLAPIALVLALGLGFATAQTIIHSLQGSQDGRGPVGLDASSNAFFPNHMNPYGYLGVTPTTTGGAAIGIITDNAGVISTNVATTFTLTFGQAFLQLPSCSITATGVASSFIPTFTVATTGFRITTGQAEQEYNYICLSPI